MEITITSFDELRDVPNQMSGWMFRGQKDSGWILETSVERCIKRIGRTVNKREYEENCLREFQRHARSFLNHVPTYFDTLEWLALMQHFGAPTRLLDFTDSFWIAVFFAYEDAEKDCAVWAIDRESLGNRSTLRHRFPQENSLDFNKALRENINFGRYETEFVYHDVPFYTNERLAIQKGTFLFTLNNSRSISELIEQNEKRVRKFVIRKEIYSDIRRHLNDFNCNARVLFPGIDGFARYFKNHNF
jgi:hypothetical protein